MIKCDAEDEELQQPWCKELDEHIGILAEDPGEGKIHLAQFYTGFTTDCILRAFQISSIALVKLSAPPQLAHSADRWNRRPKSEDLFAIFISYCPFLTVMNTDVFLFLLLFVSNQSSPLVPLAVDLIFPCLAIPHLVLVMVSI